MVAGWRLLHEARRERATCQSLPRDDALSSHTRRRLKPHPSFLSALGKREVLEGRLETDAAARSFMAPEHPEPQGDGEAAQRQWLQSRALSRVNEPVRCAPR